MDRPHSFTWFAPAIARSSYWTSSTCRYRSCQPPRQWPQISHPVVAGFFDFYSYRM